MYSKILGTGSYLPSQVRSNADLEKMVDTTDEWIVARTGIRERRIADENETVAEMGYLAAEKAIEMAGIDRNDIDLVIVATTSGSHNFPSSACQVQAKLGIKGCPAFDLAAACSGFVYALSVADQHIKTGMCKNVLVIGADVSPNYAIQRTVLPLSCSAMVQGQWCWPKYEPGILSPIYIRMAFWRAIKCRGTKRGDADKWLHMAGNEVFKVAVTQLSKLVKDTLDANDMHKSELDWLVPHQANYRIISATAKKLSMSLDQVVITLDKHGNTSADDTDSHGRSCSRWSYQARSDLLLEAFGGGLLAFPSKVLT